MSFNKRRRTREEALIGVQKGGSLWATAATREMLRHFFFGDVMDVGVRSQMHVTIARVCLNALVYTAKEREE